MQLKQWQTDIDRAHHWVSEQDYLMFSSQPVFLWKPRGVVPLSNCLDPSSPLCCMRGEIRGSISRGCFVLEAAESQCPQQPLNLLSDAISIVNVWLESACSFSLSRFSVIPLLQQQNQILFRQALIVADMLACCSESGPNVCDNGPLVPPDKDPRVPLGRAPAHNAQNKKSIMTGAQSIWHTIFAQWVERAGTRAPSRSHRCQKALEGVEWFHGGLGAPFWFRSNYWGPVAFKRIFF